MTDSKSTRRDSEPPAPRRWFLKLLTAAVGTVATLAVAIPGVGYIAAAARRSKQPPWVALGAIGNFQPNETVLKTFDNPLQQPWDGMTAKTGVYVRYLGPDDKFVHQFLVFAIYCTHLGCPVEWFPQSGLFMCPCHGGVYYENGEHASGPPPRGLYHCVWRVQDGQLEIQAPHLPTLQDTLTDRQKTT
jgi:Rieske Fe-S protein